MIPLCRPYLPKMKKLQKKFEEVLDSGMLTNSKFVQEFENDCSKFLGVKNTVAVSSGTSALILALKCLGIKGEVILPSFTFTSDGLSLLRLGLKPVFVDIDPQTLNINPDLIEKEITSKTSCILATHVFGNPCEIDKIQKIAKKHNLKVIYDAAHAFGSKYKNKSVVKFGDASIISFTPTKVITTGEGGLVVVKNKNLARIMRLGRNNGDSFNRKEEFLGITARMDEFSAILGIEGLKIIKENLRKRLKIVSLYKNKLGKVAGISFQKIKKGNFSDYKDFVIMVNSQKYGITRDNLLKNLKKNGIECKAYFYPALHQKIIYKKYLTSSLPVTDFISDSIISIPLYSHMPGDSVIKICSIIKSLSKNYEN